MTRSLLRCAVLACPLALPVLAGCVPVGAVGPAVSWLGNPATTSASTIAGPTTSSGGRIVSMSLVPAESEPSGGTGSAMGAMTSGVGSAWSSLLAIGSGGGSMHTTTADSTAGGSMAGQATSFRLRMDDGSTLTVVQGYNPGLHAGDRVRVIQGDHTHVVPAA
jgi:outer membrane lipoprotein SlyB